MPLALPGNRIRAAVLWPFLITSFLSELLLLIPVYFTHIAADFRYWSLSIKEIMLPFFPYGMKFCYETIRCYKIDAAEE